ncbi:MAG TPA: glycosyl transferase family 36 [Bacillota bacterium]|nr:glycosyl transferase family 36 [Bacillota bacterium]
MKGRKGWIMDYGYFLENEREFVITRPDTPLPWINYLSNGRYCALISQLGGGYSFFEDPRYRRLTRYRYNSVPADRPGRYIYLRDAESGIYWSPTWQPVGRKPELWRCRHGLGYTGIISLNENILTRLLYLVPLQDNLEIWQLALHNLGRERRRLQLFTYVEFALFNAMEEFISHPNLHYFSTADYCREDRAIYYSFFKPGAVEGLGRVFISAGRDVAGFDCDREAFIGPYRSENNPLSVEEGMSRNSKVIGGNAAGSLQLLLELEPCGEEKVSIICGVTAEPEESAAPLINKYSSAGAVERELARIKGRWQEYLAHFRVETPDSEANGMINIWNQYQCRIAFDWSRYASYFHTGTFRGIGFRDSCQDTLGVLHAAPGEAREKIKLLAANMYPDGHSYHLFFPVVGKGDPTPYSDDHLWLIHAVSSYIKETGDRGILDETVPYIGGGRGSLYEHLVRAVDYTRSNLGPRGLPRMFHADWNDCLDEVDREGRGESVWTAFQLHLVAMEMTEMAALKGNIEESRRFCELAGSIRERVNEAAWDGGWYVRAFNDAGEALGSAKNEEGKIYLNAQSWAVISGVAGEERGRLAMDAVREHLDTGRGLKLLHPPYRSFPKGVGSLLNYPPGLKENGAIFCHAHTWAIIAEAMLGRGDLAYRYYRQILPPRAARSAGAELYRVEPYVYCQFIFGPDHPRFGRGSHSWLTGTAAWAWRAFVNWILGIRPAWEGLLIDPCLPADWEGYRAERIFRGANYDIEVRKPRGICKGKARIIVDGKEIPSRIILPPPAEGGSYEVTVLLEK